MNLDNTFLGIELGSTRIKAVLIGEDYQVLASGNYVWENRLIDKLWTYSLDEVWVGIQNAYAELAKQYYDLFGIKINTVGGICISAMMHGYLAFGKQDELLTPFRTWRNTNTSTAAEILSNEFSFNIPLRWSCAHFLQAVIDKETHVMEVSHLTTLAGYVHLKLTGRRVLGVGDASGMFPIGGGCYDETMMERYSAILNEHGIIAEDIFPQILLAGDNAGCLTAEGALLLDPGGNLKPGIPLCPPEGDAGTGMAATNSVEALTGNVSAGTSIFAMIVLPHQLGAAYPEIDIVSTPDGKPVAMVHCNNCTSDIDAWVSIFKEFVDSIGHSTKIDDIYERFYCAALEGDSDYGGLISYNYYSGEPITGLAEGRPLFVRMPDANFTLSNFTRTILYSALATLRLGMNILIDKEKIIPVVLIGHGGLFKVADIGRRIMAAALNLPIAVNQSAGEGGAFGAALLAAYASQKNESEELHTYLRNRVFRNVETKMTEPDVDFIDGYNRFMQQYIAGLDIERIAVRVFRKKDGS